jgi:hypothetical protein
VERREGGGEVRASDEVTFEAIEESGQESFLRQIKGD